MLFNYLLKHSSRVAGTGREHRIFVVGIGGAGCNALASMVSGAANDIGFVAVGCDPNMLNETPVNRRIQLGRFGDGAPRSRAAIRAAARGAAPQINAAISGAQVCFIAATMAGTTASAAAPAIAAAIREQGILTVAVVTTPFAFEGPRRARIAQAALEALRRNVDALVVIPNEKLLQRGTSNETMRSAFARINLVLEQGVRSTADLLLKPGLVNLGLADLGTVIKGRGRAVMGTGVAGGEKRAILAATEAVTNPLLKDAIAGARRVIISIAGGEDLRLSEMDEAVRYITAQLHPEAEIIWGSVNDPDPAGLIRVSVVATGLRIGERPTTSSSPSAVCVFRKHEPVPKLTYNQGFDFSHCRRCGCGIIRSGDNWRPIPRGFRVVWRRGWGTPSKGSADTFATTASWPGNPRIAAAPEVQFGISTADARTHEQKPTTRSSLTLSILSICAKLAAEQLTLDLIASVQIATKRWRRGRPLALAAY